MPARSLSQYQWHLRGCPHPGADSACPRRDWRSRGSVNRRLRGVCSNQNSVLVGSRGAQIGDSVRNPYFYTRATTVRPDVHPTYSQHSTLQLHRHVRPTLLHTPYRPVTYLIPARYIRYTRSRPVMVPCQRVTLQPPPVRRHTSSSTITV